MPPKPTNVPKPSILNILAGFIKGMAPDGENYIVPSFAIPNLFQGFAAYQKKLDIGVLSANAPFNEYDTELETEVVGNGLVVYPVNPILSDRERLALHAKILALQDQLGISYKDTSHQLYLAEMEKLKMVDKHCKALANLKSFLEDSLKNAGASQSTDPDAEMDKTDKKD